MSKSKEFQTIEELVLTLQACALIVICNMAFPLVSSQSNYEMKIFALAYGLFFAVNIFQHFFAKTKTSIINGIIEGVFLTVFIILQFDHGYVYANLFYVYIVIQSLRYQKISPLIISIITICFHTIIFLISQHIIAFEYYHLSHFIFYFVISMVLNMFLKELSTLRKEKEYYIHEVDKKNVELEKLILTDYLTKLYNCNAFHQYFEDLSKNDHHHPLSLAIIDIDNFKIINDTYGHLAGNAILKQLAEIFIDNVRDSDLVARYGGEEFAIIFPMTNLESAIATTERIRLIVEQNIFSFNDQVIGLTISIGVDTIDDNENDDTYSTFIQRVDNLLYQAKNLGKNQVCHTS
ncbi:MAG: GGDEF domain-containing protein [Clostridia bacterium]|nr:GGDEF domain-containing protein [Clostridia bacterium]